MSPSGKDIVIILLQMELMVSREIKWSVSRQE